MELEQLAAAYGFTVDPFAPSGIVCRRGAEVKKFTSQHEAILFFTNW